MQTSLVVLEYLKALVWPVAVTTIVVVFRTDLRRLLTRLTKLDALGASAEFEQTVVEAGVKIAKTPPRELPIIRELNPTTFTDANLIRMAYRDGPVLVDLTAADDDMAKRLVDFSAGLLAGNGGTIERVARSRFLLSPPLAAGELS